MLKQFVTLLGRESRSKQRNKPSKGSRVAVPVVLCLLLGTLYFQQGFTQFGLQNRISFVYLHIIFCAFSAAAFVPDIIHFRPDLFP